MLFAFVEHFERERREGGGQPLMYFVGHAHFRQSPPSIRLANL
jgi:hypothetical protein